VIIRWREAVVTAMDSTTLISLQGKLMAELKGGGKLTREEYLALPLVGPVLTNAPWCSPRPEALHSRPTSQNPAARKTLAPRSQSLLFL
jgi:hypothetical protein